MRRQNRAGQPIPSEPIHAYRVADPADPVQPLRPVVHMEKAVVVNHRRVEDVVALPIRTLIGEQQGIGWMALQAE